MRSSLLGLTISATLTTAQIFNRPFACYLEGRHGCTDPEFKYLDHVCAPRNSSGFPYPDLNSPCNAVDAIINQCIWGAFWFDFLTFRLDFRGPNPFFGLDPERACICNSQIFDQIQGCVDCYAAHGATSKGAGWAPSSVITSLSSSYCALSNYPTSAFAQEAWNAVYGQSGHPATYSTVLSDPIGNKTDVSLYFTPSVTGTAAWLLAEATITPDTFLHWDEYYTSTLADGSTIDAITGMSKTFTYKPKGFIAPSTTGSSVSSPTPVSDSAVTTKMSSTSARPTSSESIGSASSGSGIQQTAAVVGVMGLAGLVALL